MGNRLTKIYTRTGDDGNSALSANKRLSKFDIKFQVLGDVDELNAHVGMIWSHLNSNLQTGCLPPSNGVNNLKESKQVNEPKFGNTYVDVIRKVSIIQHLLFNMGGEISMPEYNGITPTHIQWIEKDIDSMNDILTPLKDFILPAGSTLVSQIHIARTVCRRAERLAVHLKSAEPTAISSDSLKLLNRLSDWLFVLARYCTKLENANEVLWDNAILDTFSS